MDLHIENNVLLGFEKYTMWKEDCSLAEGSCAQYGAELEIKKQPSVR